MAPAIEGEEERPAKRAKLLFDDDGFDSEASSGASGGVALASTNGHGKSGQLKVNEEYARRFEHNQKRAELHRCRFKNLEDVAGLTLA